MKGKLGERVATSKRLSQDIARAVHRLSLSYRRGELSNPRTPLNDLVFIILSGQTNEELYTHCYQALKRKFPKWEQVLESTRSELAAVLKRCGLSYQKANYIHGILSKIKRDFGKVSLAPLRRMDTNEAEKYLLSLPGVGIKTARCVLMYTLDRDVYPLDVHCRRIMERIGWIHSNGTRLDSIADAAQSLIPANLRRDLHVHLVQHGRETCRSESKNCVGCKLADMCTEAGGGKQRQPTVVDLCCGAGGFSLGFLLAGYRVLMGVDMAQDSLLTFEKNIPGSKCISGNIADESVWESVRNKLNRSKVDVVISGPPCQGFSRAGRRKSSDERNNLYVQSMRLAVRLKPDVIVFENVANLGSARFNSFLKDAMSTARHHGYSCEYGQLNALHFGVPQNRLRNVLIATNGAPRAKIIEILRSLEATRSSEEMTVGHALRHLPTLPAGRDYAYNHEPMNHSVGVRKKIKRIEPGTGPLSYRKLHPDRPAPTLICGNRAFPCHFRANRTITVREAARIQSFPDSYLFYGSRSRQMQQVADAVPPLLGLGIASAIASLLKGSSLLDLCGRMSADVPLEGGNGNGLPGME